MYSRTTIVGRAGRDPEMRYLSDGTPVTNVNVAVDSGFGDRKTTVWYRCTFWRKTAEVVNEYVGKGDLILVEGEIKEPRIWTTREGEARCNLELNAQSCKFLSSKRDREARQQPPAPEPARTAKTPAPTEPEEEEIPW